MLYYTHNVVGTVNLIEAMRKHGIKNVSPTSLSLPSVMLQSQAATPQLPDPGAAQHTAPISAVRHSRTCDAASLVAIQAERSPCHLPLCAPKGTTRAARLVWASPCRYLLAPASHLETCRCPGSQAHVPPACICCTAAVTQAVLPCRWR